MGVIKKIAFLFLVFFTNKVLAQNLSGVVNVYSKVTYVDATRGMVKLANISGFGQYLGNKVLIIQMRGATMAETNDASFGNVTSINNAGAYEVNQICGFINDTMVFKNRLVNNYNVNGNVQIVIMPRIASNATITAEVLPEPWDEATGTGGVLAIEVPGTLNVLAPINANGKGFTGGSYLKYGTCFLTSGDLGYFYNLNVISITNGGPKGQGIVGLITGKEAGRGNQVNGGGGGNNHNSGGGGGANYGAGGAGGQKTNGSCKSNTPGLGGSAIAAYGYTAANNKIFFGGGGGAGHDNDGYGMPGGNGGGIIYIKAATLNAAGATTALNNITANGVKSNRFIAAQNNTYDYSWSDGAGGGGAGGTVILNVNNYTGNEFMVEAKGGNGNNSEGVGNSNCSGPGGGGGGGAIWFSAPNIPALAGVNVNGGNNGIVQFSGLSCNGQANGATSGGLGGILNNFTELTTGANSAVCGTILNNTAEIVLQGNKLNDVYNLQAQLFVNNNTQKIILQKQIENGSFIDIVQLNTTAAFNYNFTDAVLLRTTVLYRAKLVKQNGSEIFSNTIRFTDSTSNDLQIQVNPNPFVFSGILKITSPLKQNVQVVVFDAAGAKVQVTNYACTGGQNQFPVFWPNLQLGAYFIKAFAEKGGSGQTRFIKATVY
jgi:hypothetical protein